MASQLTVGSLFSGIGGIELGLERAGMQTKWQAECDPFCQQVLAKHWPNVKRFDDVKEITSESAEQVDLICGGFPCQPISRAGKRRYKDDERWLWPEFARVLSALRPSYVLMENTDGLLSRGLGQVLGDLAALRYNAEWYSIAAAHFGAPHVRQRTFVIAFANGAGCDDAILCGRGTISDEERDHALSTTRWQEFQRRLGGSVPRQPGSRVCGGDDGIPRRVDRLRALGNAVVPQIAEWIGKHIVATHKGESIG